MTTPPAEGVDAAPLSIRVLSGSPTAEELAAVMAVVTEAYADELDTTVASDDTETSAWVRRARAPRRVPAAGSVWGRFEGR